MWNSPTDLFGHVFAVGYDLFGYLLAMSGTVP